MEGCSGEKEKMIEEPLLDSSQKGGFRAIAFIIASAALGLLATNGIRPNMIVYLMREYQLDMAAGSKIVFSWTAATYFAPLTSAIIADSFIGRFRIYGCGVILSFLGMLALWLTSMIPQARPPPCNAFNGIDCIPSTIFQLFLLRTCLGLISIGAGAKAVSLAFGADQLILINQGDNHDKENTGVIKSYINWYYALTMLSTLLAFSVIVYIQESMGWKVGFGIPAVLLFFSLLSFYLPSSLYVKLKAKSGWATELIQVIVAAYRKRNIELISSSPNYHHKEGSSVVLPSEKLRFFNRACIILNPHQELNPDGTAIDPWTLCTVGQVEDLKSVIKVIPFWFTGMVMELSMTQITILTLQAKSMDRKIWSGFEIPAGSFGIFGMLSNTLWVPIYDYIILPIASRIKGKPINPGVKLRMGIAICLACVYLVVEGVTENIRRNRAIGEADLDNPEAIVSMSAMWLIPQLIFSGFTEGLCATAQYEFFYLELPKSMASISSILFHVEYAIANLLSSLIMSIVDDLTKRGGNDSWISSNINRGHFDYFYWVIAAFCLVDLVIYLIWSKAYGPCKGETTGQIDEEKD